MIFLLCVCVRVWVSHKDMKPRIHTAHDSNHLTSDSHLHQQDLVYNGLKGLNSCAVSPVIIILPLPPYHSYCLATRVTPKFTPFKCST